jgi:hypothetical protein
VAPSKKVFLSQEAGDPIADFMLALNRKAAGAVRRE